MPSRRSFSSDTDNALPSNAPHIEVNSCRRAPSVHNTASLENECIVAIGKVARRSHLTGYSSKYHNQCGISLRRGTAATQLQETKEFVINYGLSDGLAIIQRRLAWMLFSLFFSVTRAIFILVIGSAVTERPFIRLERCSMKPHLFHGCSNHRRVLAVLSAF